MASQFSPKVSEILAFSREEAARLASRSVGPEHLMLGLLRERNSIVSDILSQANVDMQSVKHDLEMQVRENDFTQPINTQELVLNTQASNILKLAVLEARMQSTNTVEEQHLLLAILHDQTNNGAKTILESNSISYEDVLLYIQQTAGKTSSGLSMPDEDEDDLKTPCSTTISQMGIRALLRARLQNHQPPYWITSAPTSHKLLPKANLTPWWGANAKLSV